MPHNKAVAPRMAARGRIALRCLQNVKSFIAFSHQPNVASELHRENDDATSSSAEMM
jgi:hypothetical protein